MGSKPSCSNPEKPLEEKIPLDHNLPKIDEKIRGSKEELNTTLPRYSGVDDGLLDDPIPSNPSIPAGDTPEREPPQPRPAGRGPRPPIHPTRPGLSPEPHLPPGNTFHINYSTKKNIAQGMMDIALLTANASQLRYVLRTPVYDAYIKFSIGLICSSIILQVVVGVALIFLGRYDYKRQETRKTTQLINNFVVALIFVITVVNVFIAAFGVDDERTIMYLRAKSKDMHPEKVHP